MKTRFLISSCVAALMACAAFLHADVRLPEIFDNNMVLQRDMNLPVWGWADPNETVQVSFGNQTAEAKAGTDGKWMVQLKPLKASAEPAALTVKGKNEIKLTNVLVGDVWLCSGQSNMEWAMSASTEYQEALKTIDKPNIRLFHVTKQFNAYPQDKLSVASSWRPCNAESIPRFSAVGYYFGSKLHAELNVPIGLINSSWGGTRIEPWTPPEGFQAVPTLKNIADELDKRNPNSDAYKALVAKTLENYQSWIDKSKTSTSRITPPPTFPGQLTPYSNQGPPTTLYNAMVHPFVPLAMKGAIWYQGEANMSEGMMYAEKMKALINGWRTVFKNPDLGFYYVQLAPFFYGDWGTERLPELWEAQSSVEKALPKTGQAVINDLVTNVRDIHPPRKQLVGERLALLALNRTYGKNDVVCDSPEFDKMETDGNTLTVYFKNAKSLKTRDGKAPDWFEIAGENGVYHKAGAVIDGATIKLKNANVPKPLAVRFAWAQIAEPNVQNEAGLQLGAFRAGNVQERAVFDELVPNAKNFKLLYRFDPTKPVLVDNEQRFVYASDYSGQIVGKIKRVGYFLNLVKGEKSQHVFITMPPLNPDPKRLGVPVKATGVRFQQRVKDVQVVVSNVPSVKPGKYDDCNVEFWETNYGSENTANVPGASSDKYDFGDQVAAGNAPGYGSMQIHDIAGKQTLLAFNNFRAGPHCDVGIGNNPDQRGNPDWTFSHSADSYAGGQFLILVEME